MSIDRSIHTFLEALKSLKKIVLCFHNYILKNSILYMMTAKPKVVVGMSGGIDSSVTAYLLQKAGYDCIGVQMQYWAEEACALPLHKLSVDMENPFEKEVDTYIRPSARKIAENKCCSDESMLITREICDYLKIPFYSLNVKEVFKEKIVDYFLDMSSQGITPNPCTECNKYIKFGELLAFAEKVGADYVATGHYAKIIKNEQGEYDLYEARDKNKDQSYFLYALSPYQRSKMLLPLGDLLKPEVREIAEKAGLSVYKKTYKESQGLCFYAEKTPEAFLERHLDETLKHSGPIKTIEGKTVGIHRGLVHYTVGQRKGLDIGGLSEPHFVIRKDHDHNTLYIGPKANLYQKHAQIRNSTISPGKYPSSGLTGKIRYRMQAAPCTITVGQEGSAAVSFEEGVFAITPGQVAIIQEGEKVIGGGIIEACLDHTSLQQ